MTTAEAASTVCVECGATCHTMLQDSPRAPVRVARCEACGRVSDRYIEHDATVLIVDLLLHRTAAYRHLLFNRLAIRPSNVSLLQLGAALAVCDVHLKRTTKAALLGGEPSPDPATLTGSVGEMVGLAWPFASAALEFAAFTAVAAYAAGAAGLHRVAVALSYSSLGRALLVLSMIWDFPPIFGAAVEAFVLSCNMVALRVVSGPGVRAQRAAAAVAAAAVARTFLALVLMFVSSGL